MRSTNRVYFDESGATGEDLPNPSDPVFVLASCCFTPEQERSLLRHFSAYRGRELKFSKLRRTSAGQTAIRRFVDAPEINASTAGIALIHKPFFRVTKYCDLVVEPSMRQSGVNVYERGLNIATANLLWTTMPTFLNPTTWNDFLDALVQVIRNRSHSAFEDLRRLAELIHAHLDMTNREMAYFVAPVLLMDPTEFLESLTDNELDPLIPVYHSLADHWGKQLGDRFDIIADESKLLTKERERLLKCSDSAILPVRAGFDRRTVDFPLRVVSITGVDSSQEPQVQLADVIAGAAVAALKSPDRYRAGSLANHILHDFIASKEIIVSAIWPDRAVDPAQLGTDDSPPRGVPDLATHAAQILRQDPRTRRPRRP